ncbi:MAG: hypothetical protein WCG78_01845 [Candidatus Omnitrophota bacterium]
MKKVLMMVCASALLGGIASAAQMVPVKSAPVASVAVQAQDAARTVAGKVEAVTLADAAKGTKSEITVVDMAGKKSMVIVKATTTIYDAAGKALTLDKIAKDAIVKVKYTVSKEGVDEATSISIAK